MIRERGGAYFPIPVSVQFWELYQERSADALRSWIIFYDDRAAALNALIDRRESPSIRFRVLASSDAMRSLSVDVCAFCSSPIRPSDFVDVDGGIPAHLECAQGRR